MLEKRLISIYWFMIFELYSENQRPCFMVRFGTVCTYVLRSAGVFSGSIGPVRGISFPFMLEIIHIPVDISIPFIIIIRMFCNPGTHCQSFFYRFCLVLRVRASQYHPVSYFLERRFQKWPAPFQVRWCSDSAFHYYLISYDVICPLLISLVCVLCQVIFAPGLNFHLQVCKWIIAVIIYIISNVYIWISVSWGFMGMQFHSQTCKWKFSWTIAFGEIICI